MAEHEEKQIIIEGRFLRFVKRGHWEYVERVNSSGVVGLVAVTPERKLLLVEQYRIPVERVTIELPAGLAGDIPGSEVEELAEAARRELLEETGYAAEHMACLGEGPSSAGLTNETLTLFHAYGLRKVGAGGGDHSESIILHEIPLAEVRDWLAAQARQGKLVDLKIYAGLLLIE